MLEFAVGWISAGKLAVGSFTPIFEDVKWVCDFHNKKNPGSHFIVTRIR